MEYLYKYYPIEEYALNNLYREEVCFNSMSAFDDDREGKFNMASKGCDPYHLGESLAERISEDYSDFIRFKNRVLSLTKRHDMKYMWENYAGKGTGFCVEYRYQNLQDISTNIKLIEYSDNKDPNAYFEDSIDAPEFKKQELKILFRKEEKYKNECEVRLLYEIPQKEILLTDMGDYLNHKWEKASEYEYTSDIITLNHYKCPKRILKKCIPNKIYLGPNIADDSEEKIRKIISDSLCFKNIDFCLVTLLKDLLLSDSEIDLTADLEDKILCRLHATDKSLTPVAEAAFLIYYQNQPIEMIKEIVPDISDDAIQLILKYKIFSQFLIALNYVNVIESLEKGNRLSSVDRSVLNQLYDDDITKFIVQYINKNIARRTVISFEKKYYSKLDFAGQSTLTYIVGRVLKSKEQIITILKREESDLNKVPTMWIL